MNRIGFKIPAGYILKDHILWSKSWDGTYTTVSGTSDVPGVTIHGFDAMPMKDGRYRLRCYMNGKIRSYSGNPLHPDKTFDTIEAAMWFATWHSEDIFAKSN